LSTLLLPPIGKNESVAIIFGLVLALWCVAVVVGIPWFLAKTFPLLMLLLLLAEK